MSEQMSATVQSGLPNLQPYWMPFTGNRQFKSEPRLVTKAEGMYYTTHDGKRLLDGVAGLWCCNAGHCHPKIVAALDVYREEGLFARAAELEAVFEDGLHSLGGLPHVIDIRNIGLVGAVELEAIDGKPTARALDVFRRCYDRGVMVRTTGDIIELTPPLIISETQIEEIVETLRTVLSEVA